uniref:Uncharacterized protein n=2 Tax=Haplochromini TaxID=319058 RepID=A0A3Q2UU94_HAPBU
LEEMKRINHEYQVGKPFSELQYLVSGDLYDGKEDFAVVLQPFLHNSFIPKIGEGEPDTSFFSVDCFHISERAHAEMAIGLWNNMLEPIGRKQASPFIFTKINSLPSPSGTTPTPFTDSTHSSSSALTAPVLNCPSSTPVWVPVLVGIVGLVVGFAACWIILSLGHRRKSKAERKELEMKGTAF